MTLVLVTTPGAPDANAFSSLEEAEGYMATLVHSAEWDTSTDDQKTAALIQAARWLGTLTWKGVRASFGQALAWSRRGMVDQDGFEIPSDAIPRCVKDANAEFAYRLLAKDRAGDAKVGVAVGSIRTNNQKRLLVPESVNDLLGKLIVGKDSIPLVRAF